MYGSKAKYFHSEQTLNNWIMLIITSQALAFLYPHILEQRAVQQGMAAGISFADKLCVVFSLNSETKYTWQSGLREQHIQLILVLTDFNSSAEKGN